MKRYKLQKFFFLMMIAISAHIVTTSLYAGSPSDKREDYVIEGNLSDPEPDRAAVILNRMAEFHRISGEYRKAEALYQRALVIHEMIYGPDHIEVATILHNMGLLYHAVKAYEQAEKFYKRALSIREKVHGSEDISVSATLNTLAGLYDARGDYALAEPLYQRALRIDEKIYGTDHPDVAIDLKNLALLCHSHGDYAKAKPLYQRALAIEEKTYGAESDMVAMTLNHLGGVHYLLGDYAEAEPLYQRALAVKEKIHGTDSPDMAMILYNLGNTSLSLKRYDSAESFYCRALGLIEIHELPELGWRVQNELSRLLDKQTYHGAAVFFGKQAVNVLQGIQNDYSFPNSGLGTQLGRNELKRFSLVDKEQVCKGLVNLLIDQGRISEAQEIIAIMKTEEYTGFADKDAEKKSGVGVVETGRRPVSTFNSTETAWAKGYQGIRELLKKSGKADLGFFHFLQILKEYKP